MDRLRLIFICVGLSALVRGQQIANYVSNGGFELILPTATLSPFDKAYNWYAIDSINANSHFIFSITLGTAPYASTGFQFPRTGNNFILTTFYRNNPGAIWYPNNRLKTVLKPNTAYCGKYYVVNTNNNRIAIDSYGIYVGSSSLDTITHCSVPLTYLNPQIQNTTGIITDTMNWIPISGTFTAVGDEKYLVLGNFKSPAFTNTLLINTPTLSFMTNDVYIDDVSLIEMELPAYAGPDKWFLPGDSIYIGRESDVEIDESCIWYQMTSPTTSITIDTTAGLWVKPVLTSTYIVKQQLWCSGVKWDTVVVSLSSVGLEDLQWYSDNINLFPNPTQTDLTVAFGSRADISKIILINSLGQTIREEDLHIHKAEFTVSTSELDKGIYLIQFKTSAGTVTKQFVKN